MQASNGNFVFPVKAYMFCHIFCYTHDRPDFIENFQRGLIMTLISQFSV